jgi:hypothetical protein
MISITTFRAGGTIACTFTGTTTIITVGTTTAGTIIAEATEGLGADRDRSSIRASMLRRSMFLQ